MLTLSVPLLLAATSALPQALDGCSAERTPTGWKYECGDVSAEARHYDQGSVPAEVLDAFSAPITRRLGATAQITREPRRIAGRELDSVRVEFAGGTIIGVVEAMPRRTRFLTCMSKAPARCGAVLEALVGASWMAGPVAGAKVAEAKDAEPSLPVTFLGRPIKVPAVCESGMKPDGSGWVACPPVSMVHWVAVEDALKRTTAYEEWAVGEFLKGKRGAREEVPCRVQGMAARCARLRVTGAPSGPAVVITAPVAQDGKKLLVGCIAPGETGSKVPCSLIVDFE